MKDTFKRKSTWIPLILLPLISAGVIYYDFWGLGFSHDDLVFLSAMNAPEVFSRDFLSHIFFRPNSYNTHYRPFGFFGYFFTMGKVFGLRPWAFDLTGILILLYNAFLFRRILATILQNDRVAQKISILYIFHFAFLRTFLNYSDHLKYGITLLILFLALEIVLKKETLKPRHYAALFILQGLAIGCHEATFAFSFVLIGARWVFLNQLSVYLGLVTLPSFLYLVARVLFWGVPKTGYFSVHWEKSPLFLFQQIGYSLLPLSSDYSRGEWTMGFGVSLVAIGLLICTLFWLKKNGNYRQLKMIAFCLGCWVFLQIPQSPLVNHWDFTKLKALVWPTPFFFIGLGLVVSLISSRLQKVSFVALLCLFVAGSQVALRPHVIRKKNEIVEHQSRFRSLIEQKQTECPGCLVIVTQPAAVIDGERCEKFFIRNYTIPNLLAIYYPDGHFQINYDDGNIFYRAMVKNGYVFYQNSPQANFFVDIFGFTYGHDTVDNNHLKVSQIKGQEIGLIWRCQENR